MSYCDFCHSPRQQVLVKAKDVNGYEGWCCMSCLIRMNSRDEVMKQVKENFERDNPYVAHEKAENGDEKWTLKIKM